MPRFFSDNVQDGFCTLSGEDARHAALSLRMKRSDIITICCRGTDYTCSVDDISPEQVLCRVLGSAPASAEPDIRLHLFQAVPKGEKADIIVQKSVEMGVSGITFVLTARCISRPDEKSFSKKLVRYNKIALEAAKQCGRGAIPAVDGIIGVREAAERLKEFDSAVWCYEKGGVSFNSLGLRPNTSVALMIGSEGGFSDEEAELFTGCGFKPVSMGARILRCETAPIAAAAIIMNLTGNM